MLFAFDVVCDAVNINMSLEQGACFLASGQLFCLFTIILTRFSLNAEII